MFREHYPPQWWISVTSILSEIRELMGLMDVFEFKLVVKGLFQNQNGFCKGKISIANYLHFNNIIKYIYVGYAL